MEATPVSNKKTTNFRNWAFRFLIYLFLLNVVDASIIGTNTTLKIELEGYEKPINNTDIILSILGILTNILMISGIILTALSVIKKEKKD